MNADFDVDEKARSAQDRDLERDDFSLSHRPALGSCFARDLFRKPVPTFRDHAPETVGLFDGVDLRVDRIRADLLGVGRHHRIDQLLHFGAIGEGDALELAGLFQGVELGAVLRGLDLPAVGAGFLAGLDDRGLQVGRQLLEGLAGEADRPDGDRVLGHREIGADLEEFHLLDAGSLVLARGDDAVLNRVVDLVVGDHGRGHPDRREGAAPDRRALDADLQPLHLGEVAHRLVDEDVAHAAAGIAGQRRVRLLRDLVGDRLEQVGVEHLVPVVEVAEQERRVDERGGLREGRHVRRRHDAVVDGDALVHVGEVVFLQPQLAVAVEHEVERLAVVALDQLLELQQRLVEGVVVVELDCAVQGDRLLGVARRRNDENGGDRSGEQRRPWRAEHCILPRSRVLVESILRRHRSLSMGSCPAARSWAARAGVGPRSGGPAYRNSRCEARSAPSRMLASLAHTTSSATRPQPAEVSKPQSVPASTRAGSPTTSATRSRRSATTCGCSTKLVRLSITPATRSWSSRSGYFLKQRNSWAWRGLANGSTKLPTLARCSAGRISSSGTSLSCGDSELPQQTCRRTRSRGTFSIALLMAATTCSTKPTNAASGWSL